MSWTSCSAGELVGGEVLLVGGEQVAAGGAIDLHEVELEGAELIQEIVALGDPLGAIARGRWSSGR